ncbi:hypothetical protein [Arthrobacter sp. NyZ413]|uniref:hypothetical protein n=1 Tax=Arthrobacter sp. NyZ413 TaxID=3144669 RepID=UPI003BF7A237
MNEFRVSHFFAVIFLLYFIHIHFANPGFLPEFTLMNRTSPKRLQKLRFPNFAGIGSFESRWDLPHFSASAAATQKTIHAPPGPRKSVLEERAGRFQEEDEPVS